MIFKDKLTRTINFLLLVGVPFILSGCKSGGGSSDGGSSSGLVAAGVDPSSIVTTTGGGAGITGGTMASVHDPEPKSLLLMAVGILIIMAYFRAKKSKPCFK